MKFRRLTTVVGVILTVALAIVWIKLSPMQYKAKAVESNGPRQVAVADSSTKIISTTAQANNLTLEAETCQCGGTDCICAFNSCGKDGAKSCGCNGTDCDCTSKRCPKFSSTSDCTGFIECKSDGKKHCIRKECPKTESVEK